MAILDFFSKKTSKSTGGEKKDPGIDDHFAEIKGILAEQSERLQRIEIKQKETSLQLEEIDSFLQDGGNDNVLVDALIALSDTIGDFYYFASEDTESPLFEQAQMMWNAAKNTAMAAGLDIIEAGVEPFDYRFHSAESAEQDINIPNGYVIRTLKCGYIYKEQIIRRVSVVVNKTGIPDDDL